MKLGVNTALFQQIHMAAAFNDDAVFHHHDFISLLNCRQTVRDNQRGTVFLKFIQRRLNSAFRFGIQRGRRFIKDQNGAVTQ